MTLFFRTMLFVCPAACLLAQTAPKTQPPATPAPPAVSAPGSESKPAAAVSPDKVVLTVGELKLTAEQFEQIINSLPPQVQPGVRSMPKKQFAEQVVRVLLLAEEGKRRKLDQGAAYKTQIMFQNYNTLAGLAFAELAKDAPVDPAEVQKYYDAHKNEYERVKARHILIRTAGSPLPVRPGQKDLPEAEALAKAEELRKKIEAGANFADIAIAESDDTSSGSQGGDLGAFGRNQMVPPFEQAVFAMKVGELSQPVKTPFGYHIIKLESREMKSLEDMKPEIEKNLRPEQAKKVLEDIQKNATVDYNPDFFGPAAASPPAPAAK
jgi:peptidyl-prolyl cis-trans isomerase C